MQKQAEVVASAVKQVGGSTVDVGIAVALAVDKARKRCCDVSRILDLVWICEDSREKKSHTSTTRIPREDHANSIGNEVCKHIKSCCITHPCDQIQIAFENELSKGRSEFSSDFLYK